MPTNFQLKRLKLKLDIVEKPENRVHKLTDSNGARESAPTARPTKLNVDEKKLDPGKLHSRSRGDSCRALVLETVAAPSFRLGTWTVTATPGSLFGHCSSCGQVGVQP